VVSGAKLLKLSFISSCRKFTLISCIFENFEMKIYMKVSMDSLLSFINFKNKEMLFYQLCYLQGVSQIRGTRNLDLL